MTEPRDDIHAPEAPPVNWLPPYNTHPCLAEGAAWKHGHRGMGRCSICTRTHLLPANPLPIQGGE